MRIELMTPSLPRKCSTPELHRLGLSGRRGSNPPPIAWKAIALPNELLPLVDLQFTIWELLQLLINNSKTVFRKRSVGGGGFEPPKASPTDLQSAPFDHSGTPPTSHCKELRADGGIRTPDQLITNQLLWPTELHRQNFKKLLIFSADLFCQKKSRPL
jgi:hypothetical protein